MFLLYVNKLVFNEYVSLLITPFDTIAAAKNYFYALTLDDSFVCSIESTRLDSPIILQSQSNQPTK